MLRREFGVCGEEARLQNLPLCRIGSLRAAALCVEESIHFSSAPTTQQPKPPLAIPLLQLRCRIATSYNPDTAVGLSSKAAALVGCTLTVWVGAFGTPCNSSLAEALGNVGCSFSVQ